MESYKDFIKFMLHNKQMYWGILRCTSKSGGKKVQKIISVQVVYSEV